MSDNDDWWCKKCGRPFYPVGDRTEPTDYCDGCAQVVVEILQEENDQLRKEVEALRRDRERLDWIEANGNTAFIFEEGRPLNPQGVIQVNWKSDPVPDSVREAIDYELKHTTPTTKPTEK